MEVEYRDQSEPWEAALLAAELAICSACRTSLHVHYDVRRASWLCADCRERARPAEPDDELGGD